MWDVIVLIPYHCLYIYFSNAASRQRGNESLYSSSRSRDQDGRPAHIC